MDHSGTLEINLFDEQAKQLFGCEATEYAQAFEAQGVDEIHRRVLWRRVAMNLNSRKEIWQENERTRVTADLVADMDFAREAKLLLAEVQLAVAPSAGSGGGGGS